MRHILTSAQGGAPFPGTPFLAAGKPLNARDADHMRVACLSPLPPSRTGIAHYASMLLPALGRRFEVIAFDDAGAYDPHAFDVAIYQLGNNPHHEWIYRQAMATPGIAVLHDVVLHHLIVEMTLARGDLDGYVAALEASHGAAGAAWARGRAAGLHDEIGNFLLPASIAVANRSRSVIVHNRWAADLLRAQGVVTPIHVVPHPADPGPPPPSGAREAIRSRLGVSDDERLLGLFGFLTAAKRASIVLEAFALARARRPDLRLLIAGEPAPDIDLSMLQQEGVITSGYVPDAEFPSFYAAADRLINLRYPSAGETSGTVIRAFAAGKPVAVSDYAQFAELPGSCVVKIPLGSGEANALAAFFLESLDEVAIANAQRMWLAEHATLDATVDGYAAAIDAVGQFDGQGVGRSLPLFPALHVLERNGSTITLQNRGDAVLRTRVYGQPGYRVLAKLYLAEAEAEDRWIELPGDLAPGQVTTIVAPYRTGATLRLYHAIEGVPTLDEEPWYAAAL